MCSARSPTRQNYEQSQIPVVVRDAPLGTYLGWNITATGFHQGQICNYTLQERYGDLAEYVQAVRQAAENAVAHGFLLQADASALAANAQVSMVLN